MSLNDMDKQERRKKLDKSVRALQEEAAALYDAHNVVEAYKKRKRVFVTPPAANEAEEDPPSFKEVLSCYTPKTKEEIIESGTLKERLLLFLAGADFKTGSLTGGNLTEKENKRLLNCIIESSEREPSKRAMRLKCAKEYQAIMQYSGQLRCSYLRSQACFAILANLLNRLEAYGETAEKLTSLFQTTKGQDANTLLELWGKDFKGARLLFDEERQSFYVDANEPNGTRYSLNKEIEDAADDAASTLSDFKAYAKAGEEFVKGTFLKYQPISMRMAVKNVEEERYPRYMVRDLSYFRSDINRRMADGETITPEEERRAVIPDFYEVPTPEDMYQACKALFIYFMS